MGLENEVLFQSKGRASEKDQGNRKHVLLWRGEVCDGESEKRINTKIVIRCNQGP